MKSFIVPALLITFTTAVPVGLWRIYAYYRRILEKEYGTWKRIGTLHKIIIYPLEGVQGIPTSKAFCSRDGPAMYASEEQDNTPLCYDRGYVFYSNVTDKAITLDPTLIKISNAKIWNLLLKSQKFRLTNELRTIQYLGNEISVNPVDNVVPKIIYCYMQSHKGESWKIGLMYNFVRSSLNPKKADDMNLTGNESNFWNYTLVNLSSLEPLQKILRRQDLTYVNFLPNFVIDCPDYESYIEDNIKQLKIGKVFFENVTPCTHTPFIEANPDPGFSFAGLFEALQSTRALNKLYPRLSDSQNAPVFGINLKMLSDDYEGDVHTDDPIYATFRFDKLSYLEQLKEIIAYILTSNKNRN